MGGFEPRRHCKIFKYEPLGSHTKLERIQSSKKRVGSRNDRNLKKYSEKFNKMFDFYLKVYRSGLITFCGGIVQVDFDVNGSDGKFGFREFDNGRFKNKIPTSRHPNILKSVIIGKKGWGLWVKEWTEGIVECSFTKKEFVEEFKSRGIEIPEPLMKEWDNLIERGKYQRNLKYLESLGSHVPRQGEGGLHLS